MRSFLQRHLWPIVGITVFLLFVLTAGAGVALFGRGRSASSGTAETSTPRTDDDRLAAYRGLGSWVDLWDLKAWHDPAGAVADMSSHGVTTLYVQTGTTRTGEGIANPSAMSDFIIEAHRRGMYVVAWYLPNLKAGSPDFERVVQAFDFTSSDGQKFDSIALDIESTTVKPVSVRNRNLIALSAKVRNLVGHEYPLGAIIPSPVGLKKQSGFWNVFPYAAVAEKYDVLLPMAYYTFHGHTAKQAGADAAANMRLLRAEPGCGSIPVHLIGGITNRSTAAEVSAFTRVAKQKGCIGVSLYDWAGTSAAQWKALRAGFPP